MLDFNKFSNLHNIVWECGDVDGKGHRQRASIAVLVYLPEEHRLVDLLLRFDALCIQKLNLHIDRWFTEDDDNRIPADDETVLDNLGVAFDHDRPLEAPDFFDIWRQLVPVLFPGAFVLPGSFGNYTQMTGGYGLWDSKVNYME